MIVLMPALLAVHNATGVYHSTVSFLFLAPSSSVEGGGNSLRADPGSTIYFAAVVERHFNQGAHIYDVPRPTSAPLYATGVKHGSAVYLPDQGGQWQTNFNKAELRIEIVGESEEVVLSKMRETIDKLRELSTKLQQEMGIWPESRITTETSPEEPAVGYAWIRNNRAEMAVAALIVGLSVGAAHIGDSVLTTVSRKRREHWAADAEKIRPRQQAESAGRN
ncbi:hypothetical protein [Paeniglutamicibacter sp.]|uniref:hypothetical protein n=1 Tax=Paeniglutamicibacter sp. TaxID=1934391 RepID=UPI00398987A2